MRCCAASARYPHAAWTMSRRRRLLLATLACVRGLNRRELEPVLSESEAKWLALAKAVKLDELPPAVGSICRTGFTNGWRNSS